MTAAVALAGGKRAARAQTSHHVESEPLMWKRHLAATLLFVAIQFAAGSALAQANFDRPGGDYAHAPMSSGDPADCALLCEHDRRCRSWSFSFPSDPDHGAMCWLKNSVPARVANPCCVSGVRGAGVLEPRNRSAEISIDRPGGDLRSFEVKNGEDDSACRAACTADNKCRAWTFARRGYIGRDARCFLKKEIKPPRRRPGFTSGVVR